MSLSHNVKLLSLFNIFWNVICSYFNSDTEVETFEIIKENSDEPNTYRIICTDNISKPNVIPPDTSIGTQPGLEIYEFKDEDENEHEMKIHIEHNQTEVRENIAQLLKIVVDEDVLNKFGYPDSPIENVLNSVIKHCGLVPIERSTCSDALSNLRENTKLLFTSVIDDESIKEMLNNHTIDEVVSHFIKVTLEV